MKACAQEVAFLREKSNFSSPSKMILRLSKNKTKCFAKEKNFKKCFNQRFWNMLSLKIQQASKFPKGNILTKGFEKFIEKFGSNQMEGPSNDEM